MHDEHDSPHDTSEAHLHHVMPLALLAKVFAALLVLTALTVGVTYLDVGAFNLWIALAIAVAKAGLVALYFMHLRYDSPFNGVILVTALLFVAVFIGLAILDTKEYRPDFEPPASLAQ